MTRSRDWLILKCRHADTLILPARLQWASIEAYAPAHTIKRRESKSRSRRSNRIPLAPGIVFIAARHTAEMIEIHERPMSPYPAFTFMRTVGEFSYCPDDALAPLRLAEMRGRAPEEVRQWQEGELVRYSGSGFEGLVGTVERRKGKSVWVRFGPLVVEAPAVMLAACEQERIAA